jgi:cellulose synthase/poly-beta-1,6-N-acetylglucosamine synthase-like glycosyltransferase
MSAEFKPRIDEQAVVPRKKSGAPAGWHEAHRDHWAQYKDPLFEEGKHARWKEATGLSPEESHFTLIVPIHDEQRFLPDALGAIIFSEIPPEVNMNVVLVTNACTDSSPSIVRRYMNAGTDDQKEMGSDVLERMGDSGLDSSYAQTRMGNITFTHINTSTPGQSNALNLGNALALESGHKVAISTDANNFVEPDAIPNMFGAAHKRIVEEADGTAVLSGNLLNEMQRSRWSKRLLGVKNATTSSLQEPADKIKGCFMAWDTEFIDTIGGIPKMAANDYALNVLARYNGREVDMIDDARIWGYQPNTIKDIFTQYSRYSQGVHQFAATYPEAAPLLEQTSHPIKPLRRRLASYVEAVRQHPAKAPVMLPKIVLQEAAIYKGKMGFRKDPKSTTWEKIGSTS